MSKQNTGGPAFPCDRIGGDVVVTGTGMTLRDYFAAKAMQSKLLCDLPDPIPESAKDKTIGEWIAYQSYKMADAMLAAREQP